MSDSRPTYELIPVPDNFDMRLALPHAGRLENRRENCRDWGYVDGFTNDAPVEELEYVHVRLHYQKKGEHEYFLRGKYAKAARESVCGTNGGKWEFGMAVNVYFMAKGDEMQLRVQGTPSWWFPTDPGV